jgi:hypothetical protein
MKAWMALTVAMIAATSHLAALKVDITHADIEQALTIARSTPAERERFHAHYIQALNTPFVERIEVVSELRRVVLMAEEQIARGDRFFAYSSMRANTALQVFRRRVSVIARVRFHPQNNYVGVPPVTMSLIGNERALIGVKLDPIYAFGSGKPGVAEFVPILGAVVDASFPAEALAEAKREFRLSLDNRELGRFTFDFAAID